MALSLSPFPPHRAPASLVDSKRIRRTLFGVYFEEDIYDRLCLTLPWAAPALKFRIDPAMRARNLIFVHVPRVAGTSIARALYGRRGTHHFSARYFRALDPGFFAGAPSFAVLRDPFDRFQSSYAFVRGRGAENCRLADVFVADTAHIATVDDYLSYLEERDELSRDFVMRQQSWFVCDLATGTPLVKNLFLYREDEAVLAAWLKPYGVGALPLLNRSDRVALLLNSAQRRRIERIYADDFALIETVRRQRAENADMAARALRVAAE